MLQLVSLVAAYNHCELVFIGLESKAVSRALQKLARDI